MTATTPPAPSPAPAPPAVLCAGLLVADLFVPPLPALPAEGALVATDDFLVDSGGCAANTATCLVKLGVPTRVAGKVGADLFGDFIIQDLGRKCVETGGIARSADYGTSKTVILPVIGEDRRYVHTFGANADFQGADIPQTWLRQARVFCVGGYLALPRLRPDDLRQALRTARDHGALTVLDVVVPAGDPGQSLAAVEAVLPEVDYFLPNDTEALALTGEADPAAQARRLLRAGCRTVVITRGGEGALLMNARQTLEAPAPPVEVVDGSGAGDAFAAGLIVGLLEGWEPARTLQFASVIGASACTRLGCTTGVFTRPQADAYLKDHPLPVREL
jgi:sugar/nucleoside kinase (ribokinase family)